MPDYIDCLYVTGNLCNQAFHVMPVTTCHFKYCLKFKN